MRVHFNCLCRQASHSAWLRSWRHRFRQISEVGFLTPSISHRNIYTVEVHDDVAQEHHSLMTLSSEDRLTKPSCRFPDVGGGRVCCVLTWLKSRLIVPNRCRRRVHEDADDDHIDFHSFIDTAGLWFQSVVPRP